MEALLLIDIQKDFLPGGSLAVEEGDQIIPIVNNLQEYFDVVVATQDWHPPDHGSFAANHEDKKPGQVVKLNGLDQILWPVHCVQGSEGSEFAPDLNIEKVEKVIRKGTDSKIDSYSGFFDNGHQKATGLHDYLQQKKVDTVVLTGLAANVCLKFTAFDALELGYKTIVISDATRAVNLEEGDFEKTMKILEEKGAAVLTSQEILAE
ncbi:MAG: bifunctional nicotinamidase/pyrazinamidase [Candidatus Cyclobacteriaceae bacterium M3_2C_046]